MSNCKTCGWDFPQHLQMLSQIESLQKQLAAAEARLRKYEPEPGKCEHGVAEGDWCEPCNRAYKEAADEAAKGVV